MRAVLIAALAGLLVGLAGGLSLGRGATPTTEAPAPEIRLPGGAVVLRREAPGARRPDPPQGAPKGEVIRQHVVKLEPIKPGPINLEVIELQAPEGVRTVVKADGAEVAEGVSRSFGVPVPAWRGERWAVGPSWSVQRGLGVQVERTFGPVRVTGAAWKGEAAVGLVFIF